MGGSKDGGAAEHSTFLLNAQLVDRANSTQQAQPAQQAMPARNASSGRRERARRAPAAAVDGAATTADSRPRYLVGRLREMGTALTGALAAGVESLMSREHGTKSGSKDAGLRGHSLGRPGRAGDGSKAKAEGKPPASEKAPAPPSPPPHR